MQRPMLLVLATTTAVLLLQGLPLGAHVVARGDTQTTCTGTHDVFFTPGFSMQAGSGTFFHHDGTIRCTGPVNGRQPTGMGTTDAHGEYQGVSCASPVTREGGASEVFTLDVPTDGGVQRVVSHFHVTFTGRPGTHGGLVEGEFQGDHMSGTFEVTPLEGDCVTRPLTKVHVTFRGELH